MQNWDTEDKQLAFAVLRRLCQGAQIDGIRFGPILQILITDHVSLKPKIRGQTYLNIGSTWAVFETPPASWPDSEEDLPMPTVDEQLRILCGIREAVITDIALGEERPHLLLHLEDGRTLFINGRDEHYECWQVGVAWSGLGDYWMVVALPGGGVAIWSPENFDHAAAE
jgi:hypothetical protein